MSEKKLYTVAWVVNVYADTPEEAAREAQNLRDEQDDDRIDNQFYVANGDEPFHWGESVDLDVIDGRI